LSAGNAIKGAAKKAAKGVIALGSLKIKLIILGVVIVGGALAFFIMGIFPILFGDGEDAEIQDGEFVQLAPGTEQLSAEVEKYRSTVKKYAEKNGIVAYTDLILALMQQESGGRGNDPMQASESKCGAIGCISNADESIQQGVSYFKSVLNDAGKDVKLTLQSYNFGTGFIGYAKKNNGGKYSKELAIKFSVEQYNKLPASVKGNYNCHRDEAKKHGACYGDIGYVDAVLKYYQPVTAEAIKGLPTGGGGSGKWGNPIASGMSITSGFVDRINPVTGQSESHKGVDYACQGGVTPIHAVDSGKVIFSQFHVNRSGSPGYGNDIMIQHSDKLISMYAHLSDRKVKVGSNVKKGQAIGICGSTGQSTGPHLHLEAKKGMWAGHMNPQKYLK